MLGRWSTSPVVNLVSSPPDLAGRASPGSPRAGSTRTERSSRAGRSVGTLGSRHRICTRYAVTDLILVARDGEALDLLKAECATRVTTQTADLSRPRGIAQVVGPDRRIPVAAPPQLGRHGPLRGPRRAEPGRPENDGERPRPDPVRASGAARRCRGHHQRVEHCVHLGRARPHAVLRPARPSSTRGPPRWPSRSTPPRRPPSSRSFAPVYAHLIHARMGVDVSGVPARFCWNADEVAQQALDAHATGRRSSRSTGG